MTLHEKYSAAVAEYLSRLEANNLSAATMRNYTRVLGRFGEYLSAAHTEDIYEALEGWKQSLCRAGTKPTSVNQYAVVLTVFFEKASRRSFPEALRFDGNPAQEIDRIRVPKRPYELILTDEQVAALYKNEAPTPNFRHFWPRNYAMVMLFLNEKIRNSELLSLRLCDVDFAAHTVKIESGKGRKFRLLDLTALTETALHLYLASGLRPADLSDEDFLFGTTRAHAFDGAASRNEEWHRGTTGWASDIVERHVEAVCGVKHVRSHDLRHVGSRVCLNAGASLEELQHDLGHSSVTTTEIYSGRIMARAARSSAKGVLEARDFAAQKNLKRLPA